MFEPCVTSLFIINTNENSFPFLYMFCLGSFQVEFVFRNKSVNNSRNSIYYAFCCSYHQTQSESTAARCLSE